jgi:hypothetical protein
MGRRFGSVWIAVVVALVAGCGTGEVATESASTIPTTTITKRVATTETTVELETTTEPLVETETSEPEVNSSVEPTIPPLVATASRPPSSSTALPRPTATAVVPTTLTIPPSIDLSVNPPSSASTPNCPGDLPIKWNDSVGATFDKAKRVMANLYDIEISVVNSGAVANGATSSEALRLQVELLESRKSMIASISAEVYWSSACASNSYQELTACVETVARQTPSFVLAPLLTNSVQKATEIARSTSEVIDKAQSIERLIGNVDRALSIPFVICGGLDIFGRSG